MGLTLFGYDKTWCKTQNSTYVSNTNCRLRKDMTSNKESVIKDKVMDERGPVPDSIWAQLQIRGSGTQVNDALTRWGWSRDQLVVTPVIITEPSSGKVMGSKWEVRGKVA